MVAGNAKPKTRCFSPVREGIVLIGVAMWFVVLVEICVLMDPIVNQCEHHQSPKNVYNNAAREMNVPYSEFYAKSENYYKMAITMVAFIACASMMCKMYSTEQKFFSKYMLVKMCEAFVLSILVILELFIIFALAREHFDPLVCIILILLLANILSGYFWLNIWNIYTKSEKKLIRKSIINSFTRKQVIPENTQTDYQPIFQV